MPTTLTETLRTQLGQIIYPGYPERGMGMNKAARQIGVSQPTLSRFLSGKQITTGALDLISIFVEAQTNPAPKDAGASVQEVALGRKVPTNNRAAHRNER